MIKINFALLGIFNYVQWAFQFKKGWRYQIKFHSMRLGCAQGCFNISAAIKNSQMS
jgi:hypothetical protein